MIVSRLLKRPIMSLFKYPGRIPFVYHLMVCLKQYFPESYYIEHVEMHEASDIVVWGHYDSEFDEWIQL